MEWVKKTGVIASMVLVSGIVGHNMANKDIAVKEVKKERYFPAKIDFAG